jgi:hypothetical protein
MIDHPGVRAQRTLTLIAKSLQGLANMTTFGIKEPWMSPMNEFLAEHKAELQDFVDSVTNIPPALDKYIRVIPPSYATPITIYNRISQASKEGFPSLPYLIDQPRAFAALVAMWAKYHPNQITATSPETQEFHDICRNIQTRIAQCVDRAENAERPGSSLSVEQKWEEVASQATGVPARDGVYTRNVGRTGLHRVNGSSGGGVGSSPWPNADVGSLGYSVNVSAGSVKSRSFGGILGFGGSRRKGKIEVSAD